MIRDKRDKETIEALEFLVEMLIKRNLDPNYNADYSLSDFLYQMKSLKNKSQPEKIVIKYLKKGGVK